MRNFKELFCIEPSKIHAISLPQVTPLDAISLHLGYPDPNVFPHKEMAQAAEFVVDIMTMADWDVRRIWLPVLKREQKAGLLSRLGVLAQLVPVWIGTLAKWPARGNIMLPLGQTMFSMIRGGVCFRILSVGNARSHRIISLHGSVFMGWTRESRGARLLRWVATPSLL